MGNRIYDSHGAAAEYPLVITRAMAVDGARRRIRFHGSDGRERSVMVDIPPGVTTGSRLPVAIADGAENGLSYGDLVLAITVVPHQTYECRGADVYVTLQVDRASALREGRIEVSIQEGRVLAVPVQPGTTHSRFVYAGQGLPRGYAPRRYGDLILRLELLDVEELIDEAPENGVMSPQPRLTEARAQRSWWQSLFRM